MKKQILTLGALLALAVAPAFAREESAKQYVDDFHKYVEFVTHKGRHFDAQTRHRADSIYDVYVSEYDRYAPEMTKEEKEKYYESKGRFDAFRAKGTARRGGEKVADDTQKVWHAAKEGTVNVAGKVKDGTVKAAHATKDETVKLAKEGKKKGGKVWRDVKGDTRRDAHRVAQTTDTAAHRTGRFFTNTYDESAAFLRGLFKR